MSPMGVSRPIGLPLRPKARRRLLVLDAQFVSETRITAASRARRGLWRSALTKAVDSLFVRLL